MTTAAPAFRYLGIADETTVCELCGREELRSTVVLAVFDADGNHEATTYYGSTCAARALGISGGGREVRRAATAATVSTLRNARDAHQRLVSHHARVVVATPTGGIEWTRPLIQVAADAGVATAVTRVAEVERCAALVAAAAALGFPTLDAVERRLRRDGWL